MKTYRPIQHMTDEELLQVLIREKAGENTAKQLLDRHQTLPDLFVHAELEELEAINGIGRRKALLLKTVVELAQRLNKSDSQALPRIKSPEDVFRLVQNDLHHRQQEVFLVLLLNTKHAVTHRETISVGSLNASIVHPREVFRLAVKKSASAMILVHNHPSNDPAPSKEDIQVTKRLVEAGGIIGISVLDHIIIGGNQFVSLREEGSVEF